VADRWSAPRVISIFSHPQKLAPDQLARIQTLVNRWLGGNLRVDRATMSEAEARSLGAIGAFGEKYGEIVSVYTITDADTDTVVSREMCGGPHVPSVQGLAGTFRILREEAVSAGVRRIKAVLD
jgi:alanyl-tRNA synthetase